MPKIHKVYPSFFNGVSQQSPELLLDSQCKEMENCVPSVVEGLNKRPPVLHQKTYDYATTPAIEDATVFHTYDRGDNAEEYIFVQTSDTTDPVQIKNKAGEAMTVEYDTDHADYLKAYLSNANLRAITVQDRTWAFSKDVLIGLDTNTYAPLKEEYTREAFVWLKRGSGDRYNPYNYAVYLNGVISQTSPNKPANDDYDPATGYEDSDYSATQLASIISGTSTTTQVTGVSATVPYTRLGDPAATATWGVGVFYAKTYSIFVGRGKVLSGITVTLPADTVGIVATDKTNYRSTAPTYVYDPVTGYLVATVVNKSYKEHVVTTEDVSYGYYAPLGVGDIVYYAINMDFSINVSFTTPSNFVATALGSVIKIVREDGGDFEFSSWDSWGNQASFGWKESVNKITDLPKDIAFADTYVRVTGDEQSEENDYFVKWNGSSWEETADPEITRGKLTNMPIKIDRTGIAAGVSTFKVNVVDWALPRVGNLENNPDPSFAPTPDGKQQSIQDMFFYKNRLGIASEDSVVLSETANYTNFYIKTVRNALDTDVIDITIATNQASQIYYTIPFNNSLYIFTKYAQYELASGNVFSPTTVSIVNTSNYPMAETVAPIVVNDSLYFVSKTNNRQQLRQYLKTDSVSIKAIDLNISTPTYLTVPIKTLEVDGVLGYVLCTTDTNTVYLYNFKEDGTTRIQSAWSTWTLLNGLTTTANSYEYHSLSSTLLVFCKTATDFRYQTLQLDSDVVNGKIDASSADNTVIDTYAYTSKIVLPDYYPKLTDIRTPANKLLIKRVKVEGVGAFDAEVYRKDYATTYEKLSTSALKDLDFNVASRVGNVIITIKDTTANDFNLTSVIVEGMFTVTSKELQ
jgi:hypothetical protein